VAHWAGSHRPDRKICGAVGLRSLNATVPSDMHALLGVLADHAGDESAGTRPQPDLSALARLTAQVTDAGLPVTFIITGVEGFPVAQGLQLVAYRIVQEALTNALKHGGPGAHARVDIRVAGRTLSVEVVDQGGRPPVRPYGQQPTQGRGLLGIRERVAAYDGTLEIGPRPGGGWRVLVLLPRTEDDKP